MNASIRLTLQIGLTGPIYAFGLLAWPFAVMPFVPGFWRNLAENGATNAIYALLGVAGVYGILALPFSILLPVRLVRKEVWLKLILVSALFGGCVTAIGCLSGLRPSQAGWPNFLMRIWVFGGPVVVAVWNLTRLMKAAEPGATDNPDDAQRFREDH